jgi:hypothetical protein
MLGALVWGVAKRKVKLPPEIREMFVRAGKAGAKKLSENMTPEQKTERAKAAANARWKKYRATQAS